VCWADGLRVGKEVFEDFLRDFWIGFLIRLLQQQLSQVRPLFIQGGAHIKTILATGGSILGNRPLEIDGISPQLFIEFPDNKTAHIFRGLEQIRVASEEEIRTLPSVSIFGLMHFLILPFRSSSTSNA
jgi:hypothetical protein